MYMHYLLIWDKNKEKEKYLKNLWGKKTLSQSKTQILEATREDEHVYSFHPGRNI